MKSGGLRVAVQAAVLAVLMPAAGYAGELRDKIEYCTTCHGDHGQGLQAYFTAPRLAGQTVEYLENQFKAISAHRRDNPAAKTFMVPVMESVPQGMRHGLAKHFSELHPSPASNGPRGTRRSGQEDFRGWRSGRERSRMRRLSRAGCAWQRSGSAPCGSALFLHRGATCRLD